MRRILSPALGLLAAGCVATNNTSLHTFDFDMNIVGDEWVAGVADVTPAQAAGAGVVGDFRNLPAPLPATRKAIYLSGTNPNGDVFFYLKKHFTSPLSLNSVFSATLQLEFTTNLQAGCTSGAGPLTVLKAGVTDEEPIAAPDGQGVLRMNLNKGAGTAFGEFVQVGDIRNTLPGCPAPGTFGSRATPQQQQIKHLVLDPSGGFWIFIGTQSSFAGFHEIYVTRLRLVLGESN